MNPQYSPYNNQPGGLRSLVRLLTWLLFIIALVLLVMTFAKGKVSFDVPSNSLVYVNGHRVQADSVSLRTGSYTIRVVSPAYEINEGSHRVYLWPTTYKPELKQRLPDAILSSVIGANGQYGKPGISDVRWYENNTWLAGEVGPGSGTPIALHYGIKGWQVGYYPVGSYPQSLNTLPVDVAKYIQSLEVKYAN